MADIYATSTSAIGEIDALLAHLRDQARRYQSIIIYKSDADLIIPILEAAANSKAMAIEDRLAKLEAWAHEPFDFSHLTKRLDALEARDNGGTNG